MTAPSASLRRTPLYDKHVEAGAKMIDFGGWEMPVKYTSESEEHLAVRSGVGVFDVSHMGELFITGPDALAAVQLLVTNDAEKLVDGQCMYAGLLNAHGGFIDDVIVNRFSPEKLLVCVNASNQDKDFAWCSRAVAEAQLRADVTNDGPLWAQIAVQGPQAAALVARFALDAIHDVKGYHFKETVLAIDGRRVPAIAARTGYTGEDGFELYVKNADAPALWDALVGGGAKPCGLAARDTLRLEAGLALYGNDIDDTHTPLEANLGWIVKLDAKRARPFIGADALRAQKEAGVPRLLRGLEMIDRGIARHGHTVHDDAGAPIGVVTSGTQAPFVGRAVAMAYLDRPHHEPGAEVYVDVRGKKLKARVVKLPFYRRP